MDLLQREHAGLGGAMVLLEGLQQRRCLLEDDQIHTIQLELFFECGLVAPQGRWGVADGKKGKVGKKSITQWGLVAMRDPQAEGIVLAPHFFIGVSAFFWQDVVVALLDQFSHVDAGCPSHSPGQTFASGSPGPPKLLLIG